MQGEVELAYAKPNTAQTDKMGSNPKKQPTPEKQAIDKALKEAEATLCQQANSESKEPVLSEDELRQVMTQERDIEIEKSRDREFGD